MASAFSWLSSALGSVAQSWIGSSPIGASEHSSTNIDLSYFASSRFELDTQTAFMPPEPPLTRLDGDYELWESLLDAASKSFTCPGDEEVVPESQVEFGELWRGSVREVSKKLSLDITVS
jgi:hypothetical protein